MASSMNWVDGSTGGTPVSAANLNKLMVTADAATAGTPTGDALRAAFVPKWAANTAYAAGEFVLNPSGQIVSANAAFTSGTTYNAANWTVVSGGGGASDATTTAKGVVQLAGDIAGTAAAPTVPALASKVGTGRQVLAGTGLTGGGDLTVDRTLAVAYGSTAGTAVQGNDTRVVADQVAGTASIRTLGTGAAQAAAGNHTHTATGISDSTTTGRSLITAASASAARTTLAVPSVSGGITDIVQLTQAAYTALGAGTVATTLYVIVG